MAKKSRQKHKYLENKKSFQGEIKAFFLSFLNGFQLPKSSQTLRRAFKHFLFFTFFYVMLQEFVSVSIEGHIDISKKIAHFRNSFM